MTTVLEPAYAKLNLTLDVLGKREDGYHDLQSIMQTISLCDDVVLEIGTGKPWVLTCNVPGIHCDRRNLAWKAAEVFFEAVNRDPDGLAIHITKRIPSGAGMGGGSADAAAVMRGLNRYYQNPLSVAELADLSAAVGSDVPFCVLGGTAMAEGRGERLRKIPDMPACVFAVCKPEFSVSTPELYRKIDAVAIEKRPDSAAMEQAIRDGDLNRLCDHVYNVFDPVVSAEHPELDGIKATCDFFGAKACQMTGSGSAVFAIVESEAAAGQICNGLKKHYPQVFIAKPV